MEERLNDITTILAKSEREFRFPEDYTYYLQCEIFEKCLQTTNIVQNILTTLYVILKVVGMNYDPGLGYKGLGHLFQFDVMMGQMNNKQAILILTSIMSSQPFMV